MRRGIAVLAVTLLFPLVGCGDPIQEYCTALRENREELAEMVSTESGPAPLLGHLPLLRDLAEKAPDDLVDEWQTFLNAVENLDRALERAGVEPEDFEGGKPPVGLSAADQAAIQGAATEITDPEVVQAASGISQQATDVCKVNFGL